MPVLDHEEVLGHSLAQLQALRAIGHEVIVSDGGSRDKSPHIARTLADLVIASSHSRASRLNAGAYAAGHDILLFLLPHLALPAGAAEAVTQGLARSGRHWGGFGVHFNDAPALSLWRNLHSRLSRTIRLDQALFIRRSVFEEIGGFREQPILEDLEINQRLIKLTAPHYIGSTLRQLSISDSRAEFHLDRQFSRAWRRGADPYDILAQLDPSADQSANRKS